MSADRSARSVKAIYLVVDLVTLWISWSLAMELRFDGDRGHLVQNAYAVAGASLVAIAVLLFYINGLYDLKHRPLTRQVAQVMYSVMLSVFLFVAGTFFVRYIDFSRLVFIYYLLIAVIVVPLGRVVADRLAKALYRRGYGTIPFVALGDSPQIARVREHLEKHPELRYRAIPETPEVAVAIEHVSQGTLTDQVRESLADELKRMGVRTLVVDHLEGDRLKELMSFCQEQYFEVIVVPDLAAMVETSLELDRINNIPLMRLRPIEISGWQGKSKRIFDLVLAAIGLVLTAPIWLVLAVAVKLDSPGPALFRQTRLGLGGSTFRVLKFRTMRKDAEEALERYLQENPQARAEFEEEYKLRDDPRVTRLGHFLRRTSLDELPQLWNVFKGEMSLVGPRPIVPGELAKYGEFGRYLLRVPPGMTGLWQVNGRNDLSYEERIKLDMYYIRNWSIWLDLSIFLRTFPAVILRRGAY